MKDLFPRPEEQDRDAWVERALGALDPASGDPGYWLRFHRAVMSAVQGELGRRRMVADLTVSDLVASWGRAVIPTAMLTAAAAAFLLFQPEGPGAATGEFEAIAFDELDEQFYAAPPEPPAVVIFAAETF